jgi:hypothetical protein
VVHVHQPRLHLRDANQRLGLNAPRRRIAHRTI